MIRIGRFEIRSVVTGRYRLDGGAMFGVVPKVLWAPKTTPDEQNRIALTMRSLLAVDRQGGRVVLVDAGAGDKWSPDAAARFAIQNDSQALPRALAEQGLSEADVTDVIIPHLHFDHCGGLTEWVGRPGAGTCLRFPRAHHWVHERHWQHATQPTQRDRASFLECDLQALAEADVVTTVTGDSPPPPFEGLRWQLSHGHTPYQLLPLFQGDQTDLLFVSDMIPTVNHLPVAWVMAYDLQPAVTVEEKREVYRRCAEQNLLLAFPHDPICGGAAVELVNGKPAVTRMFETEREGGHSTSSKK